MHFYALRYERDGETLATFAVHAADEADAVARADAFFTAHPEHDPRGEGIVFRVGLLVRSNDLYELRSDDGVVKL